MSFLGFRGRKNDPGTSSQFLSAQSEVGQPGEKKNLLKGKTYSILKRLEASTTPRDIRETLGDLRRATDISDAVEIKDVRIMLSILHTFEDDDDLVLQILTIFSLIMHPQNEKSDKRRSDTDHALKCSQLMKEMADVAPLLLDILKNSKSESKKCAARLLHDIAEDDYSAIHKVFLSPAVCEMVVELATSTTKEVHEECLQLLLFITSVDPELQVIFGQEKVLERLLSFMGETREREGSTVISDILTVIRNILRGNRASQLSFVQYGYLRFLIPLFNEFISLLRKEWKSTDEKRGINSIGSEELRRNLLFCLELVTCIFDSGSENYSTIRGRMVSEGVFEVIAALALCGSAADDVLRIAALRISSQLLMQCEETVDNFVNLDVITLRSDEKPSERVTIWPAMRALIENITSEIKDPALFDATLHVFASLLSVTGHLVEKVVASIFTGVYASPKIKQTSVDDTGQVFLEILFQSNSSSSKYYAAHLLRLLVSTSAGAKRFLSLSVSSDNKIKTMVPNSGESVQKKDLIMVSDLYITYTIGVLHRCLLSTTTLSAYMSILFFLVPLKEGVQAFATHRSRFNSLLRLAASESEGSVHVRFWCGALAALICVHAEKEDGEALHKEFEAHLGGMVFFKNILFDVKASTRQWESPVASAFACGHPVLYDLAFVEVLQRAVNQYRGYYENESRRSDLSSIDTHERERQHVAIPPVQCPDGSSSGYQNELERLQVAIRSLEQAIGDQRRELEGKDLKIQQLSLEAQNLQNIILQMQEKKSSSNPQSNEGVVISGQEKCALSTDLHELQETVSILSEQIAQKEAENSQLAFTIQSMDAQLKASGSVPLDEIEELKKKLQGVFAERDSLLSFLGYTSQISLNSESTIL